MRTKKTFIISLIGILCITIISALNAFGVFDSNMYVAKDGLLSLEKWDAQEDGVVELKGEWEFYPNELITPSPNKDVFNAYRSIQKNIPVPEKWDNYIADEPSPFGVGTYRLLIKVPEDGRYGVKMNTIRNANKVFINAQEAGAAGVPSKSAEDYRYDFKKYVAFGESKSHTVELVVQVANKEYERGGIVQSIDFGEPNQILAKQGWARLIEAFLIAGYLLFALFYAGTQFQGKNQLYELFFSLFCLAEGVYVSTVNERWLFILFPNVAPETQVDIQMTAMSFVLLFFILFMYYFFDNVRNKKLFVLLCSVLVIEALIFLIDNILPNTMHYLALPTKQSIVAYTALICYAYIFSMLMKAFLKKTEESLYVLMVGITFFLHGFLLAVEFLYEVAISNIILFLYLVMIFSLSSLMRYRLQSAVQKAEKLSADLLLYDKLKDDFLAKTSHELSTPLHGIINLSQTLVEGVEGPLRKKQQESLLLIHTVGKRLAKIVEDLLFVSNIKEGHTRLMAEPISIRVVEEVLAEMAYLIPSSHDVQLVNKIPEDLPLIYMDEQKLKQVLFNLIYNAIKFTTQGTITITATVEMGYMSISVLDTGKGIDSEHLDLIFSSFYQVERNGKSEKVEGLGLGLSITKKIVEDSGGQISVTSEVGQGSCFTFTVPLANEEQLLEKDQQDRHSMKNHAVPSFTEQVEPITELLATKVSGTKPYTILVVDDEPANLKVLMNMIRSLDYSVIAVDSGQEALNILKEETIDLIILDLMMPEMSGYEVSQAVREEYDLVELPIIILTAAGQLSDLVVSFQMGANDFLQKPVNLEELKVRVDSLLMMKNSAQETIKQELSYYYAQIKPHFLYNTMNTIIALSYTDEKKTREALEQLAVYFRAKLDFKNQNTVVPIEDELELLEAYLSIEQIRFENRLEVVYQIDHSIDIEIPFMTLQPLAENAIQHGLMVRDQGGTLWVTVERQTPYVKLIIEDNGVGIPLGKQQELLSGKNKRVGFTNPLKKLSLIKGASVQLESQEGKGTKITILLPE